MTEEKKHIKIEAVRQLLESAAGKFVTKDEAVYFSELYLEAHFKKYPRMNPIQEALDDIEVWEKTADRDFAVDVDKAGTLLVDCKGLAPALKVKYIHDELEKKAKHCGIAAAGFRNSSGVVTLNLWSDGLARRDMVGISMFNGGGGCCVPHNGTRGFFGTAPMAYAIPTSDRPIVLDMATTEIPFFDIDNARKQGTPLKAGAAVDRQGCPTLDAAEAFMDEDICNLLPMGGGFKGYGIVMLMEVLTGALVRSLTSAQKTQGWNPSENGGLIMAIDIGSFTDIDRFKDDAAEMCAAIRSQTPAEGQETVAVPGDRGYAKMESTLKSGEVEITQELFTALKKCASGS